MITSDEKVYSGIGLMSGTSLDGIDIAGCNFFIGENGEWRYQILHAETIAMTDQWVQKITTLPSVSASDFIQTDREFGHFLGKEVRLFIEKHAFIPDFISSHGQTIFHQPEKGYTCQIGDGETMVTHLPCVLVSNFRNKDVALNGQGAPLVPGGEKYLFRGNKLFMNMGGICNVTFDSTAFDICPCNMALNFLSRQIPGNRGYDENGNTSRSGEIDQILLLKLEELDYYQKVPPKSLGQEWFDSQFKPLLNTCSSSIPDKLATVTQHVVNRICAAIQNLGAQNEEILITGGGAHNLFLMELLAKEGLKIIKGHDPLLTDFKEALIFAFLGLLTLRGEANVFSQYTGSSASSVSGSIHLPVSPKTLNILA